MRKVKTLLIIIVLIFTNLGLTGCWDVQDITHRAFVTSIGIDLSENDPNTYKVSFEIIVPSKIKNNDEKATLIETTEGETIIQASERLQTRIPRTVFFGHLRIILIGEKAAQQNFKNIMDFVQRTPQTALRLRLRFVKGEARDAMVVDPIFDKSQGHELSDLPLYQSSYQYSLVRGIRYLDFITDLLKTDGRAFGTAVYNDPDKDGFIQEGGAVYGNWVFKGWLDSSETQAANWILGGKNAAVIAHAHGATFTYQVDNKSTHIVPIINNGQVQFTVNIETDGQIIDIKNADMEVSAGNNIQELENLFQEVITNQAQLAIDKAQKELGLDYLGFDHALKYKKPQLYQELNWYNAFPGIPISVSVKVNITRFRLGV